MTSILTTTMDMMQALVSMLRWEEYEKTLVFRRFDLITPLKWLYPQYTDLCPACLLSTLIRGTVGGLHPRMSLYAPGASRNAACYLYAIKLRDLL